MPNNDIERIRQKIRFQQYDMSAHAMEEMAEDYLTIMDIETAILNGCIVRVEKDDPRGSKYIIAGTAVNLQTPVGVVGRFSTSGTGIVWSKLEKVMV